MKRPFLQQVAEHYACNPDSGSLLFIFPNRRSMVFFRHYLCSTANDTGRVFLLPQMISVSDFYSRMSGKRVADRIYLLKLLYECYSVLRGAASESFDNFVYWGDTIISDFSDIDKYRVDARTLFANISELKSMELELNEYADKKQRDAIEQLLGHFSGNAQQSPAKASFVSMWQILYPLYERFHHELEEQGMAYDGMVYRDLADRISEESVEALFDTAFPDVERAVFVGLNALSQCENAVMKKMKDVGLAEFCWDFAGEMLSDPDNLACGLMRENVERFGQAFTLDECRVSPKVNVLSVPSAVAQAKLLPAMLEDVKPVSGTLDTAVVLADETLLMPVLSSIPTSVGTVNVTMGYPLSSSQWVAMMRDVLDLQLHIRYTSGGPAFYSKSVVNILSSSILDGVLTEDEKRMSDAILERGEFYVPQASFSGAGILPDIFKAVVTDEKSDDSSQISDLAAYLKSVNELVAGRLSEEDALHREFAIEYHKCIKRLDDMHLGIRPRTWLHLVEQVIAGVSVPFEGEPLGGLQIMGPLETRALDFKNIIILSADEEVFPRRSVRASFILPELRAAFGLPTYERQDAVWAYYFFRMICRAENVWMVFDSRSEGTSTGEESRYVKQLDYLYRNHCSSFRRIVATARANMSEVAQSIEKSEADIAIIKDLKFSPSTLQKYIECPVRFYYYAIKGLHPKDEAKENVEASDLGTVCHDTLQAIYSVDHPEYMDTDFFFDKTDRKVNSEACKERTVSLDYLKYWLGKDGQLRIKAKVDALICHYLHCESTGVTGRNLVTAQIAAGFVKGVVASDVEFMERRGWDCFTVIGLELPCFGTICNHRFGGYVDRVDLLADGQVRIVDYKTGGDRQKVLSDTKPENMFSPKYNSSHGVKAALQFFIYDLLVPQNNGIAGKIDGRCLVNSMYSMSDMFKDEVRAYPVNEAWMQESEELLSELLVQMEDPEFPFYQTKSDEACRYCDYKMICGRKLDRND